MPQRWTLYNVWYLITRRRNEKNCIIWASEASKGYFDNVQIKMRYWKCWNRLNDKNKNIINRLVVKQKLWYLSTSIELTTLMKHFENRWSLWSQCIDIFETVSIHNYTTTQKFSRLHIMLRIIKSHSNFRIF